MEPASGFSCRSWLEQILDSEGYWQKAIMYKGTSPLSRYDWTGGTFHDRFEYTGRPVDFRTGLQNNRARWLDPASGRWMSEAPLGFAGGDTNLYRYVGGSYANATDPRGLESVWPDVLRLAVAPGSYIAEFGYAWASNSVTQWSLENRRAASIGQSGPSLYRVARDNGVAMALYKPTIILYTRLQSCLEGRTASITSS